MANEILKFADTATNLPTQAEYLADAERHSGNVPGVAKSKLVNKVLRQCAFISNGFAEYLISKVGGDVLDDNDSTALLAKITSALTVTRTNDNIVINGNFDRWQRNTTFAVTVTNTYTADRFVELLTGSTATVSRQPTTLTESFNASWFKRTAVTSSVGASNFYSTAHKVENVRRSSSQAYTLTFWAKADSSRNMSVEFVQNFGTGGSPSADVTAIGVQKLALTTSWQKFVINVTFPSISGKVIGTNENSCFYPNFWFDAGSSYNARTSSLGQQSGTFDIAQTKMEIGSESTPFVLAGKTIEGDLAACQRYFEKSYAIDTPVGFVGTASCLSIPQINSGGTSFTGGVYYKVVKRVSPTVTFWSLGGTVGTWSSVSPGGAATARVVTANTDNSDTQFSGVIPNNTDVFMKGHWTADAEL